MAASFRARPESRPTQCYAQDGSKVQGKVHDHREIQNHLIMELRAVAGLAA
jgi:hypothetical protein